MFSKKGFVFVVVLVTVLSAAAVAIFWMADNQADKPAMVETAKSGFLKVGVEFALAETTGDIGTVFSRYYPDASIEVDAGLFGDVFNRFLQKDIEAMLWRGLPGSHEISLLERKKMEYRLEPVARSAVICIVNAANPVSHLCVEDLEKIYTAGKVRWNDGGEIRAYLNHRDIRLQQQFLAAAVSDESRLTARYAESDEELMQLVADETWAIGILPLSRMTDLTGSEKVSSSLRIVPLCPKKGDIPVYPSQYTVYSGKYPLGYIIYYMYRKEKFLATGFGAWLIKEGQKSFMRSSLAPYRQPVRVIKLK